MKKIVFVIESLHCGGAEKSLVTLLQNLDFKNYQVDLLVTTNNGDFQKFVPKEVNIKHVNVFSGINKLTMTFLRLLFLIRKKLNWNKKYHPAQLYWKTFGNHIKYESNKYDIAIAYNQGFSTYFVATKMLAKTKFSWLNTDYKKAGYNILFDYKFYDCFDKVICVSKECENSILNEVGKINKDLPTTIIKDITDELIIKKLSQENDGFDKKDNTTKLLTVGRLAKAKGYHLAIDACKILIDRGHKIKWYIIGNGPEINTIEKLIKDYNLENNIILLGFKENPYPYIRTCDIYVQTSLFEGLGLTVIEASVLHKPIVTTNFPTASSIIVNNETGLICDMTSLAIATGIERYLTDTDLKQKVIKNLSLATNNDKETSLKKVNELLNS